MDGTDEQRTRNRRLAAAARRHRGAFSLDMARAAGFTDRQVQARVTAGRWQRLYDGAFAASTDEVTWSMRLHAVVLVRPGAVVSHGSAARIWRLPGFEDHRGLSVVVRPPGGTRLAGVRVHETTLPDPDVAIVDGLRVTSPARTVADLAMRLPTPALLEVAAEACRAGRVTVPELAARVVKGRRGAARLRDVVTDLGGRGVGASAAEDAFVEMLSAEPQLRGFQRNVRVRLSSGRRTEFDVAWLPERLVLEYDGRAFHSFVVDRVDDRRRDAEAADDGYVVRRWGSEAFALREMVVDDAVRLLRAARQRLTAEREARSSRGPGETPIA